MTRKRILLAALALAVLSAPALALAAAQAVRVLPYEAAPTDARVVVRRLTAVTSDDGRRGVVAWDIAEPVAVDISLVCTWAGKGGSGKMYVSSRTGWSKRATCDGKPTIIGTTDEDVPTVEIYYAGASKRGADVVLSFETSRGFRKPNGEPVAPSISFKMYNGSPEAVTTQATVRQQQTPSNFNLDIPAGMQELIQKSPFYKYLQGAGGF